LEEESEVFSDEGSFEEQFLPTEKLITVEAPTGKLCVVIDTPHGSGPTVHAIKDTSVLADHILIDDLLISVDDEDTTMITAVDIYHHLIDCCIMLVFMFWLLLFIGC